MGPPNIKNIYKALFPYSVVANLSVLNTRFLSFNLEAVISVLPFDKERDQMRSFISF